MAELMVAPMVFLTGVPKVGLMAGRKVVLWVVHLAVY
jgi:hypothetical protein